MNSGGHHFRPLDHASIGPLIGGGGVDDNADGQIDRSDEAHRLVWPRSVSLTHCTLAGLLSISSR